MASGEDLPLPLKLAPSWADGASPSLTVAPPRQRMGGAAAASPARNGARHERHLQRRDSSGGEGSGRPAQRQAEALSAGASRALKAELSVTRAELRAAASELSQAQLSLRCCFASWATPFAFVSWHAPCFWWEGSLAPLCRYFPFLASLESVLRTCMRRMRRGGCMRLLRTCSGAWACRGKDREVAMLRAALQERDARLAAGKGELRAAQRELLDKDAELLSAYERLTQARAAKGFSSEKGLQPGMQRQFPNAQM